MNEQMASDVYAWAMGKRPRPVPVVKVVGCVVCGCNNDIGYICGPGCSSVYQQEPDYYRAKLKAAESSGR